LGSAKVNIFFNLTNLLLKKLRFFDVLFSKTFVMSKHSLLRGAKVNIISAPPNFFAYKVELFPINL